MVYAGLVLVGQNGGVCLALRNYSSISANMYYCTSQMAQRSLFIPSLSHSIGSYLREGRSRSSRNHIILSDRLTFTSSQNGRQAVKIFDELRNGPDDGQLDPPEDPAAESIAL